MILRDKHWKNPEVRIPNATPSITELYFSPCEVLSEDPQGFTGGVLCKPLYELPVIENRALLSTGLGEF